MTGAALGRASVYFVTISGGLGLSVAAAFLCVCISLNRYIMSIRWSDGFQGWPFHVFIRPPIFLCLLCKRRREREGKRGRGREIETDRLHRLPTCNRWHSRLPLLPHPWPSQPDAFEYSEGEHFVVLELVGLSATGRHACFFSLFFFRFFFAVTRSDRREGRPRNEKRRGRGNSLRAKHGRLSFREQESFFQEFTTCRWPSLRRNG